MFLIVAGGCLFALIRPADGPALHITLGTSSVDGPSKNEDSAYDDNNVPDYVKRFFHNSSLHII